MDDMKMRHPLAMMYVDDEIAITSNRINNYNEAMDRLYRLVLAQTALTI